MKIKMTKRVPRQEGIYLHRYGKEDLGFLFIQKDTEVKGEFWVYDYPKMGISCPLEKKNKLNDYWFGPLEIS